MAATYPSGIASLIRQINKVDPTISEYVADAADVNTAQEEIEAIETELGVLPKGSYASVVARLNAIEAGMVPAGMISMWHGLLANIPDGWYLCNGENGTPNLADKFILSQSGAEEPGGTGGAHSLSLSIANMPAHDHPGSSVANNGAHTHTAAASGIHTHTESSEGSHTHTVASSGAHTHTTASGGVHNHTTVSNGSHDHGMWGVAILVNGQPTEYGCLSNNHVNYWPDITENTGNHTHVVNDSTGHTHTIASSGNHAHTTDASGSHDHTVDNSTSHTHTTDSQGGHVHTVTVASQGSGTAFDNRPAYFKLAFIMKG